MRRGGSTQLPRTSQHLRASVCRYRHDLVQTCFRESREVDLEDLNWILGKMGTKAHEDLR